MEETIKESMKEDVSTSARSSPLPSGSQETSYPIPGTSTYKAISDDSKCDYIVYMIRSEGKVIAVLVEAKATWHYSPAQVSPFTSLLDRLKS